MDKPLKFSPEMEQFILLGEKTQTRRIVKPESDGEIIGWGGNGIAMEKIPTDEPDTVHVRTVLCPYGKVGWEWTLSNGALIGITEVRVERLQAISDEDAINEGCRLYGPFDEYRGAPNPSGKMPFRAYRNPKDAFQNVWEYLKGQDSWKENPWVWVISFEVIGKNFN